MFGVGFRVLGNGASLGVTSCVGLASSEVWSPVTCAACSLLLHLKVEAARGFSTRSAKGSGLQAAVLPNIHFVKHRATELKPAPCFVAEMC